MEQEGDDGLISECPSGVDGSNERLFFLVAQVSRRNCFFGHEFDGTSRIRLNELRFSDPGKIAFQAHQCSIHCRWFQAERRLKVLPIADEQRRSYCLWSKAFLLSLTLGVFRPSDKLAQITQVVANGDG